MNAHNLNLLYYRGRVGLREILISLGLEEDDEVATQAFTCSAVPEAIMATGCKPRYIDIEPQGVNMSPYELDRNISPRVKCIIVQHTFGIPARMDQIMSIANKHDIPVIEDCCHSLNSRFNGSTVGSFGIAAFYSHEWGKPIICGLGGSVRINDKMLLETLSNRYTNFAEPGLQRRIRLAIQYIAFGLLYRPTLYWPIRKVFHALSSTGIAEGNYNDLNGPPSPEFNLKMPASSRRRLKKKLESLDAVSSHSKKISAIYYSALEDTGTVPVCFPKGADIHYSRFPAWATDKASLLDRAKKNSCEMAGWYSSPIHPYPLEALSKVGYTLNTCPQAELACKRIISLPVHQTTSSKEAQKIASLFSNIKPKHYN